MIKVVLYNKSDSFLAISDKYLIFAYMLTKNDYLSDQEIVEGLIARDNDITREFFWKKCAGIFNHIIYNLYDLHPQKNLLRDDLIQRLYSYLLDNDAHVLRGFKFRCSLLTWLRQVAYRFFERELSKAKMEKEAEAKVVANFDDDLILHNKTEEIREMVRRVLDAMPNQEMAYILRRKFLDGCEFDSLAFELGKTKANIYVIKQRAVEMFKDTYYKLEINDYAKI